MQANNSFKLGLIGFPLSHSFSPDFFRGKFEKEQLSNCSYDLFPLPNLDNLKELLSVVDGLNVTIPYKEQVIPYLDEITPEAKAIGAVNCIKVVGDKSIGYNTDYDGFKKSLLELIGNSFKGSALVFGNGGATKAVVKVLFDLNIQYQIISRKSTFKGYENLMESDIKNNQLLINTTPLGMYPNVDTLPRIPYDSISKKHFLFDLVYNPEKTLFLNHGEERGATVCNGHRMLILQAEKSWEIWTKKQTN